MRIIAGEFRGRKLSCPKTLNIRPTSDRVRENLFNILSARCEGATFLDLFAGVGTVGLEAISRGAKRAMFVDESAQSLKYLKKNLELCKDRSQIIPANVLNALNVFQKQKMKFDIIFIDPPYDDDWSKRSLEKIDQLNLLEADALIIVQHSKREKIGNDWKRFSEMDQRRYGDTILTFLRSNV